MNPSFELPPDPPPHLSHVNLEKHLQSKIRIVTLGDSVTYSQADFEKCWPVVLERRLKELLKEDSISVANAGIGGTTSGQALARWDRDVVPYKPTVLILACILNDGYLRDGVKCAGFGNKFTKHTRREATACWTELVQRAKKIKAKTVLWTTNPWLTYWVNEASDDWVYAQDRSYDRIRRRYMKFAANNKLPLVDTYREFMKQHDVASLMDDWLHHSAKGAELIAGCIANQVAGMIGKK